MVNEKLLQLAKYALLDLKGVLEQFEVSGDHENQAWKTVTELDALIKELDPEWETVVDFEPSACAKCGGEANFDFSPEGQRCGVCDDWICNACQDCNAGLGNKPYPEQDVVCKSCAKSTLNRM